MTTVVFGAHGNVGAQVVAGLVAAGERVRATSRDPGLTAGDGIEVAR